MNSTDPNLNLTLDHGHITELLNGSGSGSADDSDTSGSQVGLDTTRTTSMNYDNFPSGQDAHHCEVEFEPRAYVKMILHTAKYPHCSVSGLLLASGGRKSSGQLILTDCIPLFHQSEGLTPMVEVALAQVEARCKRGQNRLHIAGFYHANRSMKDSTQVDVFCQRIADKVAENCVGNRAVLVTIDNKRLSLVLESHALIVQQWASPGGTSITEKGNVEMGVSGKWRHCASRNIGVLEGTLSLTTDLVQRKLYKEMYDFDNHLDDITQDYLNVQINMMIDQSL